ncbi:SDR family NAD(P)-dependent oxidoreductase [Streptomyces sp.]|uniref:SDR family NAD(P)-dependent oxidoreductase n=1 Tax=Streptomyces sp. TaxID=1931 RepID=UPI0025F6666F|nr:SDR family NAD(P)-dependent oxidoreductase [Streptomyces sp.]
MSTIAITGAARGIGEAIARELASRGHRLLLGDLDPSVVDLAGTLGSVGGVLDVTSDTSYDAWWALVDHVDVLVNNAGVMWVGRYDEEPEATARAQFDVNFHGVVRGTRLAVARGTKTVVTVASAASYVAPAGEATYAATKHAVHGWMKAVRQELRGSGVQLCLVMPTVVETELAAGTSAGGVPLLQPIDVARAVADVIARPRFETFVPARVSVLARLLAVLPQRGRDLAYRRLVPDQLRSGDAQRRAEYEARFRG